MLNRISLVSLSFFFLTLILTLSMSSNQVCQVSALPSRFTEDNRIRGVSDAISRAARRVTKALDDVGVGPDDVLDYGSDIW